MGKYLLTKNGVDDYTLSYKDKSIKFHSCVEIVTEMQKINQLAKKKLILELAEKNKTINDLVVKKSKDGKIIEDQSSVNEMIKIYKEEVANDLFDKGVEKMLGVSLAELLIDIGINENEKESLELSRQLGEAMTGRFRNEGQEKVDQ